MRLEELQREIEKRKAAAKKAKEKKKEKDNVSNSNSGSSTVANIAAGSGTSGIGTQNAPATNAYMKQFEEFATGSRSSYANSDTESVASSSASNSLKRKNSGKCASKITKHQTQSNIPSTSSTYDNNKKPQLPQQPPSFTPATTNLDFCMQNVLNISTAITSTKASSSILPPLPTIASVSPSSTMSSQPKHSKSGEANVQVIDLDNYRCPSDILLTSQHILRPGNSNTIATAMPNIKTALVLNAPNRRESSSESDGVEIISIYPATIRAHVGPSQKQKYKKNSVSNYSVDNVKMNIMQSGSSTLTNNNNNSNTNNNNSQIIKTKPIEPLGGVSNYEKQAVRTFNDLGVRQQFHNKMHDLL